MIFEIIDQFHRSVLLTKERFEHILEHPELRASDINKIRETVLVPGIIKQSKFDEKIWIYYRLYEKTRVGKKYLAVIIKIKNHSGLVITAYFTDKIKEGKTIWQR